MRTCYPAFASFPKAAPPCPLISAPSMVKHHPLTITSHACASPSGGCTPRGLAPSAPRALFGRWDSVLKQCASPISTRHFRCQHKHWTADRVSVTSAVCEGFVRSSSNSKRYFSSLLSPLSCNNDRSHHSQIHEVRLLGR